MKIKTNTSLVIRTSLALALALVIWSPLQARSAEPVEGQGMTEAQMMERCKEMKEQKMKMMEVMKAEDAELTALVAKMNDAPEDKKISEMAAVITKMAEQRIAMHARKATMDEEMRKHMTQHTQMGKDSISRCLMMEGMKGMDEHSGDAQEEQE